MVPSRKNRGRLFTLAWTVVGLATQAIQAEPASTDQGRVLTGAQSRRLDEAVERALGWLARNQQRDGSFPALPNGQPGITSLSALALLSAGHLPGSEPYGQPIRRAVQYVLGCESEEGLFSAVKPGAAWQLDAASHTGYYNQAIAGLMLSEVSGEIQGPLGDEVIAAVERALKFSSAVQYRNRDQRSQDVGGWRYPKPCEMDNFATDLSVTAWQVTFLRSAKNAGYDVDEQVIKAATKYVQSLYKEKEGTFTYAHTRVTRGMTGAGIMAMAMLGKQNTPETTAAAQWIRKHPFTTYGQRVGYLDRFQYSVYYCTQGMYHLGGRHFEEFFPPMVDLLVGSQRPNGSWSAVGLESSYGDTYATAMAVLSLTTHYAMLPIHQR